MSGTAIVRVLPNPDSAEAVFRYVYGQRKGDDDARRAEVVAVEGHVDGGVLLRDARLDAVTFTSRCPAGKKAVGHAVISAERDEPGIEKKLMKSGHSWARRFAPGRGYVVICHKKDKDCSHPHVHVIFERYGPCGTVCHFSRVDLREMVGMKFTDQFQAVRPDGSLSPYRGATQVYPYARRLAAREVAELLTRGETWGSLVQKKVIDPCRVKDGQMMSFIYKEKRLRVVTVERLVDGERRRAGAAALVMKAKADALAANSRKMISQGLGDLINVVDEITTESTRNPLTHGRSR